MVINILCCFSSISAKSRAGPIHEPVEIGERCLLCGKPFSECILYLLPHRQYFPVVHLAQVDAAGEHCPYLMEPGVLPRCEAGGQLCDRTCACSEPEPPAPAELLCFGCSSALLTGLLGDCGGMVVKDKAGSWEAFCFQPTFL